MREFATDLVRRCVQVLLRNIDGYVGSKFGEMLKQHARLQAGAASKLDQARLLADHRNDLVDIIAHDAELSVGQVILRKLRNLIEQL